jgi:hypothetical protein
LYNRDKAKKPDPDFFMQSSALIDYYRNDAREIKDIEAKLN